MTAQVSDRLHFGGHVWEVLAEPLDRHLTDLPVTLAAPHTALWRGYLATWEVVDDRLMLRHLTVWIEGEDGRPTERTVLSLDGRALPHHADYVSAAIPIGRGAQVQHVHYGYESRYEVESTLEVVAGDVVAPRRGWRRPWSRRHRTVAAPHLFASIELSSSPATSGPSIPSPATVVPSTPSSTFLQPEHGADGPVSCAGPCTGGGADTMQRCSACEEWVHLRCRAQHVCRRLSG